MPLLFCCVQERLVHHRLCCRVLAVLGVHCRALLRIRCPRTYDTCAAIACCECTEHEFPNRSVLCGAFVYYGDLRYLVGRSIRRGRSALLAWETNLALEQGEWRPYAVICVSINVKSCYQSPCIAVDLTAPCYFFILSRQVALCTYRMGLLVVEK